MPVGPLPAIGFLSSSSLLDGEEKAMTAHEVLRVPAPRELHLIREHLSLRAYTAPGLSSSVHAVVIF